MFRTYLGQIGHLSVIIAFVSALVATYTYFLSAKNSNNVFWLKTARKIFYLHAFSIVIVVLTLFSIIFNKYFEYHYAWDNTSLSLPFGYAISCFWQDQEGSFLLWMFWNVCLGVLLITWFNKKKITSFESPVMTVFAAVQCFLSSMILGVVLFGDFKLGSSPFLLLKEVMPNIPVWKTQPNFIPKDGNGLNPLLQNYWMVIHPPTLFLGFATTLIPFSFAMAALWKKDFKTWIKLALPWTLLATVILGVGIMMGAIWAYETLNFGGYWNWDPVENAVYVPWLILVASLHTLLLAHKNATALKYSFVLIILQFILILYSTFLTRSGILGTSSVHSFTDLGLSGQLLCYLLFFLIGSIVALVLRWKSLPNDTKEPTIYTSEFWIYIGVTLLTLAAFQVIVTTSIPVYNKIGELFNQNLNMAMPSQPQKHYSVFQMWFFMGIVAISGIGQFFWWKKMSNFSKLLNPLLISLLISGICITVSGINNWQHILLFTLSVFSILTNLSVLISIAKTNFKIAGGALSHLGVALMLIGILFSSAYEKVISLNFSDEKIFKDDHENKENALLYLNRPTDLEEFKLTYKGEFVDIRNVPGYIEKRFIQAIPESDFKCIAKADIMDGIKKYASKGDTLEYEAENTYYQINTKRKTGDTSSFNLYPRYQINAKMGNVASPDIKKYWNKDVYSHVNYVSSIDSQEWSMPENYTVAVKDTFFLNDYVAILESLRPLNQVDDLPLAEGDIAAEATLKILEKEGERILKPVFAIKNREVWSSPAFSKELGLRVQLTMIDPASGKMTFAISRGSRDYVVLKALEKPHINLLWLGTLFLTLGIILSSIKRFKTI